MTDVPATPISLAAARRNRIQCVATARTGDQCRRYGIEDTTFCALHAHLRGCTPEQLASAEICSGCHVQFYTEELSRHGEVFRQCVKCRAHGAETRKQSAAITAAETAANKCELKGCKLKGAPIEG